MKFIPQNLVYSVQQKGFSLMEVLVSVFLVGFALLALVAMQIKTQSGVREAENLTIVAMAVDSLVEGMRANPKLSTEEENIGGEVVLKTKKTWAYYDKAESGVEESEDCTDPKDTTLSKSDLATWHICEFGNTLATLPTAAGVVSTISNGRVTVTWNTGKGSDTRTYDVTVD